MRRVQKLLYSLGVFLLLIACGREATKNEPLETEYDEILPENDVQSIDEIELSSDTEQEDTELSNLGTLELVGLDGLCLNLSKQISISNSNLARFGYLAVGDGRIFFTELEENAIYAADYDGSRRTLICQEAGTCIQLEGDYLYYRGTQGEIKRVHTDSLVVESIREEAIGEFIIKDGLIYVQVGEGLAVCNLDGSDFRVLLEEYEPVMLSDIGNSFLFIRTAGQDVSMFLKGYLMEYDLESGESRAIAEQIWYPIVAGSYISYMDVATGFRHVYNTSTGENTDLGIYAEAAVSDGTHLYCIENRGESHRVSHWNGESTEVYDEIPRERNENAYLYLSDEYLYLLQQYVQDGVTYSDWSFYNLETGERSTL